MTVTVFGHPILISITFDDFISLFSPFSWRSVVAIPDSSCVRLGFSLTFYHYESIFHSMRPFICYS